MKKMTRLINPNIQIKNHFNAVFPLLWALMAPVIKRKTKYNPMNMIMGSVIEKTAKNISPFIVYIYIILCVL